MIEQFRVWAAGPVPLRAAKIRGRKMSVETLCLGWHWRPYRYSRDAVDVNGKRVLPLPDWLMRLGKDALAVAGFDRDHPDYHPDTALVNYYSQDSKLGMHQDKDEVSSHPVVSLSIGETCTFRFGNSRTRNRPYQDLLISSGDLFVFGGAARLAFHGVTKIHAGSAPADCGLEQDRLNITLRMTGLTD